MEPESVLGVGIAIMSICGVIITTLIKFVPRRKGANSDGDKFSEPLCAERRRRIADKIDVIDNKITDIKDTQLKQGGTLTEILKAVKVD